MTTQNLLVTTVLFKIVPNKGNMWSRMKAWWQAPQKKKICLCKLWRVVTAILSVPVPLSYANQGSEWISFIGAYRYRSSYDFSLWRIRILDLNIKIFNKKYCLFCYNNKNYLTLRNGGNFLSEQNIGNYRQCWGLALIFQGFGSSFNIFVTKYLMKSFLESKSTKKDCS